MVCRVSVVSIGIVLLLIGCRVPESARERWGWEKKTKGSSEVKSRFKHSLRAEFESDAKNPWRVLNYTLHYLAREKVRTERRSGPTEGYLRALDSLDIQADSAAVIRLWERVFYGENVNWEKIADSAVVTTNSFIADVIENRLPYIMRYGFDPFFGLSSFGQDIAKKGVDQMEGQGVNYVELTLRDGLTYRATETSGFTYAVSVVARGPTDRRSISPELAQVVASMEGTTDPQDKGKTVEASIQAKRERQESADLRLKHQHEMHVPTPDSPFDIRHVTVVPLPWPDAGAEVIDEAFFDHEWTGTRFLIDIAANLEDVVREDSAGRNLVQLDAEWRVYRNANDSERVPVDSGLRQLRRDVSEYDREAGIAVRLLTGYLPDSGRYDIDLRVTNAGRVFQKREADFLLGSRKRPREAPLILITPHSRRQGGPIPPLHYGAVDRDRGMVIAMPADGLYRNVPGDARYFGMAQVLISETPALSGEVFVDSTLEVLGFGEQAADGEGAPRPTTYEAAMAPYAEKRIGLLPLVSDQPRMYLKSHLVLPETIERGTYVVSVSVFSLNPESGEVERVVEGFRVVRIE